MLKIFLECNADANKCIAYRETRHSNRLNFYVNIQFNKLPVYAAWQHFLCLFIFICVAPSQWRSYSPPTPNFWRFLLESTLLLYNSVKWNFVSEDMSSFLHEERHVRSYLRIWGLVRQNMKLFRMRWKNILGLVVEQEILSQSAEQCFLVKCWLPNKLSVEMKAVGIL